MVDRIGRFLPAVAAGGAASARVLRLLAPRTVGAMAGVALALAVAPAPARAASPSAGSGQISSQGTGSLESAARRAGDTGRKVAVSLIGLALAVAAIVLTFKRDFKEAVGVIAIGLLAVLLASPAGLSVLQDTVSALFGSS